MSSIWVILFLLSIVLMIAGTIKPSLIGLKTSRVKVFSVFAILVIVFMFLIAKSDTDSQDNKKVYADESATEKRNEESKAYMLASLSVKGGNPDKALIDSFDTFLNKIDAKCIENKDQISDMIVAGKEALKDKREIEASLIDVTDRFNESVSSLNGNSNDCRVVAADFLTKY